MVLLFCDCYDVKYEIYDRTESKIMLHQIYKLEFDELRIILFYVVIFFKTGIQISL